MDAWNEGQTVEIGEVLQWENKLPEPFPRSVNRILLQFGLRRVLNLFYVRMMKPSVQHKGVFVVAFPRYLPVYNPVTELWRKLFFSHLTAAKPHTDTYQKNILSSLRGKIIWNICTSSSKSVFFAKAEYWVWIIGEYLIYFYQNAEK